MQRWRRERGPFTHDMYSDVNGRDSQAPVWFSSKKRPEQGDLTGGSVWAFPPPSIAEGFWKECKLWGSCKITALLPTILCRELPEGWALCKTYTGDRRVLQRPVGARWVRCDCSGVSLSIVTRG
mmetsp:Transcript_60827/g.125342  ORF Transcript_60827/g.125342 Transcript_60827/m.125342 type:complete len:124 (+) Transcript_60827:703-1074(+)